MQALRRFPGWILWPAIVLGLAAALWRGLTPELKGVSISPRNVYRLEYYDASPIQRLLHYRMKIPSVVRLYRIDPETLLGQSGVVDMWINGELYWHMDSPINQIWVGTDVVFENIPPECTGCAPLTYEQIRGSGAKP